ncbi:MAG TPA: hypothetical protein VN255_04920, partial [Mycobacterium sp.]|nr:hypothetical protein [Mycobacterium sp.]
HTSGGTGGSPQMMLSAGNLNTAALSLFIALHLAVEPLVPCLVFHDPVQSTDEVHVTQFAGLLRALSKQHKRQGIPPPLHSSGRAGNPVARHQAHRGDADA